MKPFKKLSAYDNVPCEYLSSTSGADWYLTKEQQDVIDRMLESMSETLIPESDVAALKSENAKLRELVVLLWDTALHPNAFGDGSYLMERMRELGIEVE